MSKRRALYQHLKREKVEDTVQNIIAHHERGSARAGKHPVNYYTYAEGLPRPTDQVVKNSLPIKHEKAIRIANNLHKSRV